MELKMIAAIYARKSTEQAGVADDQKSIARQIDHARAFAIRKGFSVTEEHVYVDDGISGAEFATRPGFLRLMNALKPRAAFQVLVMSEESRLGRESIEVSYALKQLVQAGVRVFMYLEDRERTLDSPIDKVMLSLTTFADELEREKARQRTYDAMQRKARLGHVTGGACFGYDNVEIVGADGKRSHVERRINEREAAVVRRIFQLSTEGHGQKAIAKQLNADGAPSPRAQCGRSQSWAPSSVRAVLFRDAYRGMVAWNRTRKRNRWGIHKQTQRPSAEWMQIAAPSLGIISDDLWTATHARLEAVRGVYMATTKGQPFGRPPLGDPSKYLLTGLSQCGCCGQGLIVTSRSHGTGRKYFYACGAYHQRGPAVCQNARVLPMDEANDILIETLLDDVLDQSLIADAVNEAVRLLHGEGTDDHRGEIDRELAKVGQECDRLVSAIAAGGQLDGLLVALRAREVRKTELEASRAAVRSERRLRTSEVDQVRDELYELTGSWRRVLADDPTHARPIVSSLLKGRVSYTPLEQPKHWEMAGEGTIEGLMIRRMYQEGWRPHRDSNPLGIHLRRLFRAA